MTSRVIQAATGAVALAGDVDHVVAAWLLSYDTAFMRWISSADDAQQGAGAGVQVALTASLAQQAGQRGDRQRSLLGSQGWVRGWPQTSPAPT